MAKLVELEHMTEEQLKWLQAFLHAAIRDDLVEEGWREGESDETLPLLRGLVRYIAIEFLGEEPENELEYDHDNGDDESNELDS